jgi:hypothetical protein
LPAASATSGEPALPSATLLKVYNVLKAGLVCAWRIAGADSTTQSAMAKIALTLEPSLLKKRA